MHSSASGRKEVVRLETFNHTTNLPQEQGSSQLTPPVKHHVHKAFNLLTVIRGSCGCVYVYNPSQKSAIQKSRNHPDEGNSTREYLTQ
jgi:hypothetical protein